MPLPSRRQMWASQWQVSEQPPFFTCNTGIPLHAHGLRIASHASMMEAKVLSHKMWTFFGTRVCVVNSDKSLGQFGLLPSRKQIPVIQDVELLWM